MSRSVYVALVRHAATAGTAERRVQGRADPPLSREGESQADRWRLPPDLARLAAAGGLGWATSPLRRALDTTHRLGRRLGAASPMIEPRLAEMDYGAWQGLSFEEVDALTADGGWDVRAPGGESVREVLSRARAWLEAVAAGGPESPRTWVAVTHGGVIRVLLAAAVGWDLKPPGPLRVLPERLHRIRRRGDGHLQLVGLNEPLDAA